MIILLLILVASFTIYYVTNENVFKKNTIRDITNKADITDLIIFKNVEYVKKLKEERKLSNLELAKLGKTSPSTMSKIMRGKTYKSVSRKNIIKITDTIINDSTV